MEIPVPENRGSTGTQQPEAAETVRAEPYAPLAGLQLAQRVEGIAATRARNLGGEVAATLLAGSFSQMAQDLSYCRQQSEIANGRVSEAQVKLGENRTEIAVLEERLAAYERTQTVKQVAIFAGTALLAVAVDLMKASINVSAVIVAALGAGLLFFGWFTQSRGAKK